MKICEFCLEYKQDGDCGLGLKIPKSMTCREFGPTLEKFCSDTKDFVDSRQLVQMATYFGIKGPELKKVKQMAASAASIQLAPPDDIPVRPPPSSS